jgi:hypothetical protein
VFLVLRSSNNYLICLEKDVTQKPQEPTINQQFLPAKSRNPPVFAAAVNASDPGWDKAAGILLSALEQTMNISQGRT